MANESMIAACPKCAARYRLERARLRSAGVRLRCTRCEAVFRVTPPASVSGPAQAPVAHASAEASNSEVSPPALRETAPAAPEVGSPPPEAGAPRPEVSVASPSHEAQSGSSQSPAAPVSHPPVSVLPPTAAAPARVAEDPAPGAAVPSQPRSEAERSKLVLLADSEVDAGKGLASTLASWGLEPLLVHDGVEAILTIQRALPRLVILDAALPKMFGFQVCELMKRNESLRSIHVVLLGAIHHRDRYRRAPSEIYGADAYAERPDLPEALRPILSRFGLPVGAPAETPASPPVLEPPLRAPEVAPMPEPLLEVDSAPAPRLEVDPAPAPLLEVDPAPAPLLEVDPAPAPRLEVDPAPAPRLEVDPAPEPLLEVAPLPDAISGPGASDLAELETAPGAEALAPPPPEPLDIGMDQDFEVLDVEDDSFDAQTPLEPVAGDSLAEPFAPESLAEPEPLTLQPPVAADANALEPPTAELPLQVPAAEPADPGVSAAERLARIIVSDVVLYNPEKFEEGVRTGKVVELLDTELEEGRGLFEQRVAPELRAGRDFLAEELVRVARSRGMQA